MVDPEHRTRETDREILDRFLAGESIKDLSKDLRRKLDPRGSVVEEVLRREIDRLLTIEEAIAGLRDAFKALDPEDTNGS